jgi:CheY-like chemotaxis protein
VKPIKIGELYDSLSRLGSVEATEKMEKESEEAGVNGHSFTVLVAEDNEVNMLLAQTIVKRIAPNAEIWEASNGLEAVECCKKQMPDIILMDIQMPEMNGYEATRLIKAIPAASYPPILALTAGNVMGEREKCLAAGMDDFIAKPVVESTIAAMFDKWVHAKTTESMSHTQAGEGAVHLDIGKVMDYVGEGDEEFLQLFLTLTAKELNKSYKAIQAHVANRDLSSITVAGHKLNGTALTAGLHVLTDLAEQIEHLAEFDQKEIQSLLVRLGDEIELVIGLINKHWNTSFTFDKETQ